MSFAMLVWIIGNKVFKQKKIQVIYSEFFLHMPQNFGAFFCHFFVNLWPNLYGIRSNVQMTSVEPSSVFSL